MPRISKKSTNQSTNQRNLVGSFCKVSGYNGLAEKEVWLTVEESANIRGVSVQAIQKACKNGKYATDKVRKIRSEKGQLRYEIALSSLPETAQMKYRKEKLSALDSGENLPVLHPDALDLEELQALYLEAPIYNKRKFDKYYPFFLSVGYFETGSLPTGTKLRKVIADWNAAAEHAKLSVKSVYEMRKKLETEGYSAFFGNYGQNRGQHRAISSLPDGLREHFFATFRRNWLQVKGPTQQECYEMVKEEARNKGYSEDLLPSCTTFVRAIQDQLERESGVSGPGAVYYARFGQAAFERKYGNHADRDTSGVPAGACWVFDHMQLDLMVRVPDGTGFALRRFWVTAVADMRSWKVLYYSLNMREPSTEDIKLVYIAAAMIYGVPDTVYLDNGKDFRSKDFSGQNRTVRVQYNQLYLGSILGMTGVRRPLFAIPYNAKAKIIERIFKKWHERFEKVIHAGYTGSTTVDRVDELAATIKSGNVLHYEDMAMLLDAYVGSMNARPMKRKEFALNGLSPDEVFEKFGEARPQVDPEVIYRIAGKMSTQRLIEKNGFEDKAVSQIVGYKAKYWADWMYAWQGNGRRVYSRRDLENPRLAWFFSADTHEYLGAASLDYFRTNGLAESEEDRARVAEVIAKTRDQKSLIKSAIKTDGGASGLDILMRKGLGSKQLENGSMRVPAERKRTGTDDALDMDFPVEFLGLDAAPPEGMDFDPFF